MDINKIQIYKLIKNNKYMLLLIAIGLIVLHPIFSSNFYLSHDGEAHVARFAAYFNAFVDGQFPPRWAGHLNSGYGSAIFIFFYPLPGYIASFLHLFGITFENIFKIIISLSFIVSPVIFFLWLKTLGKEKIAFIASLAYLLLPYRGLDLFVRGDIAELLSFVFIPLVLLFIDKTRTEKTISTVILGGIFYSLLILSHNAMAVIFTPVLIAYSAVMANKRQDLLFSIAIFVIGVMLSAFFWLPAILENKYVYSSLIVVNVYKDNFISLFKLIYSPWGFGTEVLLKGGLSPQMGILYVFIPLISLFYVRFIKEKKVTIFWFFVFFVSGFMTTPYSRYLWEILPVIKQMGYPWRFTALTGFASCMIMFYFLSLIKQKIILWFFVLLLILFAIPFIKIKTYVQKQSDKFYFAYQGTTDYHLRTSSIWTAGDFGENPKNNLEIISGEGSISNKQIKSNLHRFNVNSSTGLQILDNTVYFPGWRVEVDGQKIPIEFQDMNHRGLITFVIPEGAHLVNVKFGESVVRLFSDFLTALALFLVLLSLLFSKRINKKLYK